MGPAATSRLVSVAALIALLAAAPAVAQPASEDWTHTIVVYGWGAGLSGEAGVGGVEADVDVGFSELLQNLEAGGMLAYRGSNDRWAVMGNVIFVGLGATKDLPLGGTADVDVDQWILEADGAWRANDRFEVLFGLRAYSLDLATKIRNSPLASAQADGSKTWIDPVVGARVQVPLGKSWSFVGRGDLGGFGVGSDLSWQAVARFDWQGSQRVGMSFGYLLLDVDYEAGEAQDLFGYDMTTAGPFLALTIRL